MSLLRCDANATPDQKAPEVKSPPLKDGLSGDWYIDPHNPSKLYHANFKKDMMITLSGDFVDDKEHLSYSQAIMLKLNKAT